MTFVAFAGDAYMDVQTSTITPDLPSWGQDRTVQSIQLLVGGSCSNTARQFASLQASCGRPEPARLCAALGDDALGRQFAEVVRSEAGLECDGVVHKSGVPQSACIVLAGSDDRAFVSCNSSNDLFDPCAAPWQGVLEDSGCAHVHLGGYFCCRQMQHDGVTELCRQLATSNTTVSLDPQFDASGNWTGHDGHLQWLLPYVSVFLPNDAEACGISKAKDAHGALEALTALAPDTLVVVKCGAQGALAGKGTADRYTVAAPALPDAQGRTLVDTCGAGDAFDAAFLHSFLFDDPGNVQAALALAVQAGTFVACHPGACSVKLDKRHLLPRPID
eukprot:m.105390 g.105390  ORF g.105390 m.105390 type:complete len:332 (-) comp15711_c0_seq1:22-1017(-)